MFAWQHVQDWRVLDPGIVTRALIGCHVKPYFSLIDARALGSAQICRQFFGQNIDNFHEKNCSAKFEQNIEEFWKFMRFVWGIVEFPGCFEEYWKISYPWVTWVAVKNHRWLLGRHYSKSKCQSRSKFEQNIGQFQHCQANYRPGQSKILPQNIDNSRANLGWH